MLIWSMVATSTAAIAQASACSRMRGASLSRFAIEQLGIAQPANAITGIEDHRRSHHRPEQRSTADFVHAGHQLSRPQSHASFSYFSVHLRRFSKRSLSVAFENCFSPLSSRGFFLVFRMAEMVTARLCRLPASVTEALARRARIY